MKGGCLIVTRTYKIITRILAEEFAFILLEDNKDDFSISDYVVDSITFIQFIVKIEEEIKHELPDDFLLYDMLDSAKGFAEKLDDFINTLDNNTK